MRRPVCLIGLVFVAVILLYLRFQPPPVPSLETFDKSTVTLTGQVEKKENHISNGQEVLLLYLKNVQVLNPQEIVQNKDDNADALQEISGVLVYLEEGQEARTGSYVRIRGKLRTFKEATNPGEFDAAGYYRILNLQARIQNGVIMNETVSYDRFRERLFLLREYLGGLIERSYEEKEASVMKAMLLGEKSGLDGEIKQLYQLNGVIHILSISGLHISLIGMGFYKILQKLRCPIWMNVLLSILFIYCYGVMTGMSVSAFRAVMMFVIHLLASLFGRTYDMLTAVTLAALSVLCMQPLYLYHSGFLFSFGAVLAIGLFLPALKENLLFETKLENIMSTSLSISVATLPVFLCFYYEYPLYSLFLNLLIIPGAGLIVSDGLFALVAAAFFLPLGKCAALPARLLLILYESCCTFTLHLPGSRNILGKPDHWQIAVFFLILICVVLFGAKWSKLRFWQWILAALLCITMRLQDGLQITVLDVGQGDGIYIADDTGGRYLIDGGSSSKSGVGEYQILPFLKEEGVDTLDAVFVTHMDADHYNGVETLIEQMDINGIPIKNLMLPDVGAGSRGEKYGELEALAKEKGIIVRYFHRGDVLRHGNLSLTCLHPEQGAELTTNEASLVLYLEYGAFSALLTGDLEGSGEESVRKELEKRLLDREGVTVLKVAHHGSKYSTDAAFLETVKPDIALISAGKDNRYGHPHAEVIERLKQAGCYIYRTMESGAVTVRYRRRRVGVEEFCSAP